MQHELEGTVIGENQSTICPEAGAGLGSIEVVGNGIVRGIQGDSIPLSIHKAGNAGEEGIGLAISLAGTGQTQESIARQLEGGAIQIGGKLIAGKIDMQSTSCKKVQVTGNAVRANQRQRSTGIEGEVVARMAQRGILHPHGGIGTGMRGDALAHVYGTIFHT